MPGVEYTGQGTDSDGHVAVGSFDRDGVGFYWGDRDGDGVGEGGLNLPGVSVDTEYAGRAWNWAKSLF